MIARRYIEEWKEKAPWPDNAQVEQDLIIERALIEIFSDELLSSHLAFRGGTAFHKLFLKPQARYSEDIDLVQIKGETIGPILDRLRQCMAFLEGKPKIEQSKHNNTITYRFSSEIAPVINMRLKIEINTREHFNILGYKKVDFEVKNSWFKGNCKLTTYELEELFGTKLRALYQRRKSRDLFDIYWAYTHHKMDTQKLLTCYKEYMKFVVDKLPTQKEFILNMEEKMKDKEFTGDIQMILRPGIEYDNNKAYEFIKKELLERI
ncbi:MAG TPA: nucleotidyl transferase AbiEii/AbiGii toxin family protein [Chitinophagaceae bacterium]|jgi:predicted nucleotidyltransferase component of viral defense system|nr:nucleotidyl transferase AbiEii/AbiGii toxin family protein [Chitinophagaceae bacterium]HMU60109.1 nucleotidyl transferase AbiEii/AbiGii toxin family protein [Chitinophagaceae bacterium]